MSPAAAGRSRRRLLLAAAALATTICGTRGTQDAVANGDTRTINLIHQHTKESASITFKRNGYYDQAALKELNWLLRDWRIDEPIRMEPRLFDIIWEVYREVGAQEPIHVVSAYRSPGTNAMLRRRSKAVSEQSQHMAGKAMDFFVPDASMARVREIGMRLQRGGVGFYPNSANAFVHLDAGSVRSWPRMSHDQLVRLFPDGKTVHLPRDGRPLPGYELAKAEILSRGGAVAGTAYADAGDESGPKKSLWAMLFGGGDDEDSDFYRSPASRSRAATPARSRVANADIAGGGNQQDGGIRGSLPVALAAGPAPAGGAGPRSRRGGRTEMAAAEPAPAASPNPVSAPEPAVAANPAPIRTAGLQTPGSDETNALLFDDTLAGPAAPTPPRRPSELAALLVSAPLPPERPAPVAIAANGAAAADVNGLMRSPSRAGGITGPPADDDRAALKALFDSATSDKAPFRRADIATARARAEPALPTLRLDDPGVKLRMEFSSATLDDISVDRFGGSAVAPLPTLR